MTNIATKLQRSNTKCYRKFSLECVLVTKVEVHPFVSTYFDSEGLYGTDGCAYCCIQLEYFIIWIVYY